MKDCLTVMLGANVSELKLKPLCIYMSLRPHALKNHSLAHLPVIWREKECAWVTAIMFEEWFAKEFVPAVGEYYEKRGILFIIPLFLNNVPGHPQC